MSCVLHSISMSVFAVAMQLIVKDSMFVCLHGKQTCDYTVAKSSKHIRVYTAISRWRSAENNPCLHFTVIHAIFLNTYIAIHKRFFGLSEPGRLRQGIGLWYFSKLIGCLLLNRYFLTENMSDLFYLSKIKQASHLSMSNSCVTDQTAHRQHTTMKLFFFSKRFGVHATMLDHIL